jgi:hypothetical protein
MPSGVVCIDSSERLCRLGNLVLSGQLAWPSHPGLHEFPKSAAEPPQHAVGLAYFARAGPEFRPCCCDASLVEEPNVHPSRLLPACRATLERSRLDVG